MARAACYDPRCNSESDDEEPRRTQPVPKRRASRQGTHAELLDNSQLLKKLGVGKNENRRSIRMLRLTVSVPCVSSGEGSRNAALSVELCSLRRAPVSSGMLLDYCILDKLRFG